MSDILMQEAEELHAENEKNRADALAAQAKAARDKNLEETTKKIEAECNRNKKALDKVAKSNNVEELGELAQRHSAVVKAAEKAADAKTAYKNNTAKLLKTNNEIADLQKKLADTNDKRSQTARTLRSQINARKRDAAYYRDQAARLADDVIDSERALKGQIDYAKADEDRLADNKIHAAASEEVQRKAIEAARRRIEK